MNYITDIALDLKARLPSNWKFYVYDNAGIFINISKDMTVEKQFEESVDTVSCLFRTEVGQYVALPNLTGISFGYALDFHVPEGFDVYDAIDELITTMNGVLQSNSDYRYVITFNAPILVQVKDIRNGKFCDVISLTGSIAYSDKSLFANDLQFKINTFPITNVISYSIDNTKELEFKQKEANIYPIAVTKYLVQTLSLTIHAKTGDNITNILLNDAIDPILTTYSITITRGNTEKTWDRCELIKTTATASIGGYVLIEATFTRTVAI